MFQLYVERPSDFAPSLAGEFKELEKAQEKAKTLKSKDSTLTYEIQETCGGFNSYGEQLVVSVEKG